MFLPSNITLQFGDSGDFVAELQRRLSMVGCFSDDAVNGFYDGTTVNGVMRFQGQNGLAVDGIAGPETLRRLNGVISGETFGTSDTKEEAKEVAEATSMNQILATTSTAPDMSMYAFPQEAKAETPVPVQQMEPAYTPPAPEPAREAVLETARQNELLAAERMMQQQAQLAPTRQPDNLLADMLLTKTREQTLEQPREPIREPAQRPRFEPGIDPAEPKLETRPPAREAVTEPEQARGGLVSRATRFANQVMEKLASYFEAKLPPSVLDDVKQAGLTMAKAGLREAPIPAGPELAGPAATPTRGPEQIQQRN